MTTNMSKTSCATCSKDKAIFKCGECLKDFCYNHSIDHRQELSQKLDEIEINRDLLRQTLSDQTIEPQKLITKLIKIVEKWESDSIKKIQQTADEAKQILLKNSESIKSPGTRIALIEHQLNQLTDQLRQFRQENSFVETDLQKCEEKLLKLSNQLVALSSITIKEEPIPLVTTIRVHIQDLTLSKSNLHENTVWASTGCTVAGGNERGSGLNQLDCPFGIYVDRDQTIYVADLENDRIMEWKPNSDRGQLVAGSMKQGNEINQLNHPIDVVVDPTSDSLIICDQGNRRIVRWPRRNGITGQIIISNIDCSRLAMDNHRNLYVSDYKKHEVRRWRLDGTGGTLVAGGNGKGSRLNQLNCPTFIFVDDDQSVYVSDRNNHRVVKWAEGAREGIVVAGVRGQGNDQMQLSHPEGLTVDHLGTVYVVDYDNHRIMRWPQGAIHGDILMARKEQTDQLNYPIDLALDRQGNLYVADLANHRVQKFNIESK